MARLLQTAWLGYPCDEYTLCGYGIGGLDLHQETEGGQDAKKKDLRKREYQKK